MQEEKLGVLLVNLGTPVEPSAKAVRAFLREFLSDPRVIDLPRLIWLPILYGIILIFRPKVVAKNYQKIWTKEGSPLMRYSVLQKQALQLMLSEKSNLPVKVELAMTYGQPSIAGSVQGLKDWGASQIVVLPLYPQYSHTTTAPVTDQLNRLSDNEFPYKVISDYHDERSYIEALASSIEPDLSSVDKLVMSFHGIPKRYVELGDPYQAQCEKTAELLAKRLGLNEQEWELAYQSRVGREEWLRPYLDERMAQLAAEGSKNILVVCPGFSADCLETLEEIAMENKTTFIQNGGDSFQYVDALNANPKHIEMMTELVLNELK